MADPKHEKKPQVRPDPVPEDLSEESIDRERADSGPASDPPSIGGTTAGAGCGRYPRAGSIHDSARGLHHAA